MSTFAATVRRITVSPHDNADALEIGRVGDYQIVVAKGQFQTGDLAVYIPEQAVVPEDIVAEMGLAGRLSGPRSDRVKAIRLRGVVSQGLFYRPAQWPSHWEENADVTEELGIVKYLAPIPLHLSGEVYRCEAMTTYTDIENIKAYPDVLQPGEEVVCTEKIHGSCNVMAYDGSELHVSSKGLAKNHQAIRDEVDAAGASLNAYWRCAHAIGAAEKLATISAAHGGAAVTLYGETIGVQDLMYGHVKGHLGYAAFDLKIAGDYVDHDVFVALCTEVGIPRVPELYRGPYVATQVRDLASGVETFTGKGVHLREGLVVKPVHERYEASVGRVILKVVSDAYLLRKGDTTELE